MHRCCGGCACVEGLDDGEHARQAAVALTPRHPSELPSPLHARVDTHVAGEGANTVLAGVLRGCGRQKIGAVINLTMYWGLGLPLSCFMAFKLGLGAMGLWTGLACTASLQSVRVGGLERL